ncbi:hypothetical protein SKAU_G00335020 [Synaphobranchus kaupii]|uniref:Uncharacterized protein n=1 Tax=Synaphobranchus kaupii TaxID=118154 RepID=A0A9Q1ELY6_SYNKA|nr:hypothetical protein SKAU_G00335020 [Synaphobranchus kaupii]
MQQSALVVVGGLWSEGTLMALADNSRLTPAGEAKPFLSPQPAAYTPPFPSPFLVQVPQGLGLCTIALLLFTAHFSTAKAETASTCRAEELASNPSRFFTRTRQRQSQQRRAIHVPLALYLRAARSLVVQDLGRPSAARQRR